jgi:hypothetical protein
MELEEVKDKLTKTQYNYFLQLYIFKKIQAKTKAYQ